MFDGSGWTTKKSQVLWGADVLLPVMFDEREDEQQSLMFNGDGWATKSHG